MDKGIICECGNEKFWFFGSYVRCVKCLNEFKDTTIYSDGIFVWMRRYNKETNSYHRNWEKYEF